jgi:uncharacterized protein (TIGR00645 family)
MGINSCDQKGGKCRLVDRLDRVIFASRWLLYLINLGLIAALLLYVFKFFAEAKNLVFEFQHFTSEQMLVGVLELVDMAMVANLVVMIIQGSHQIFIRRFHVDECERPQWLDHIDSTILKVKMAMSIAGITMIRILKDFVNLENSDWDTVVQRMMVHGMCLGSALVMAVIWRLTHQEKAAKSEAAHS